MMTFIQFLMNHFFPLNELQLQNSSLCQDMFKAWDFKIREFTFWVNNIFEYLDHLPMFGKYWVLSNYEIIKLIKFALTQKWQKQILVQVLDSATKSINIIV